MSWNPPPLRAAQPKPTPDRNQWPFPSLPPVKPAR
jgi:hypothetical protein